MVVDSLGALTNIVLDYAWIFGHWGFPEGGMAGAAWATVVGQWVRVVLYFVLIERPSHQGLYQLTTGRWPDLALLRRLVYYGGPSGLQLLIEVAAFSIFLLVMGGLGQQAMAATTLAFNINSMAFVPMLGLGMAVATIVGQQLGRNRPDLAQRATWTSVWLAGAYTGLVGLFYVLGPDLLLWGHKAGASPQEFVALRNLTVVLLRFVAAYCLFDAMNIVFVGALKGAGDTRFILLTSLLMSPGPVLAGWLGIRYFGLGLTWCWLVITLWICILGTIYLGRFLQGRWRHIRVIEPVIVAKLEAGTILPQLAEGLRVDSPTVGSLLVEQPHRRMPDGEDVSSGVASPAKLIEP
jgi:MATE family multidrug resistance protein